MERKDRAMNWLRSAYIVFGMIFVGIVGGLAEIISLSDEVNRGLINLMEKDSSGIWLNGRYLYPRNWLTLFIFCFSLLMLFPITTLLRILTEGEKTEGIEERTTAEISGLRQDLDDAIRFANNITSYMYPSEERNAPRFNMIHASEKYSIRSNGDTDAEAIFEIHCVKAPAHFFNVWIKADQESGEIKFLRQLNFQAIDLQSGHKLDWLPTQNDRTTKAIAVFFPEVSPGKKKKIRIQYSWPRFMGKLIELGATNFDWHYLTSDPSQRVNFRVEWAFSHSFAPLTCRAIGHPSETAKILHKENEAGFSWIYEDPQAHLASKCAVEFFNP